MANILISARCNRKCSFCFAQQRLGRHVKNSQDVNMDKAKVSEIMDFLAVSGDTTLRLMGGEPTLHPDFTEMVDMALARGFKVAVFSNGFMSEEVARHIASKPDQAVSLLCNVSPQAEDTERQRRMLTTALEILGRKVRLGVSITSFNMDYEYLFDFIDRMGLQRRVRVGIAQPIVGGQNDYVKPSEYRECGKFIIDMARRLHERDILIGFDCGLTLCMFTEEEIGMLFTKTEGFSMHCSPIIDIGPGMDVWHCFPLSQVLVTDFGGFRNRNEMVRFYKDLTHPYRSLGCKPECMKCVYLKRNQCNGGCLAHAMNSLKKLPPAYVAHSGQ